MSSDNMPSFISEKEKIPKETDDLINEAEQVLQNSESVNLLELKKTTTELSEISVKESLKLTELIQKKDTEIKNLKGEKILLERNKIQIDIKTNQELIIKEYKNNNNKFKLDLNELKTKIEELNNSNRKFSINNDELKKTISRYIEHNKNLQFSLNELKEIHSKYLESKSQTNKMMEQVKFYQSDNTRLSNELINIQNKYETIKRNFDTADKEKNDIFKQIHELNNSQYLNKVVDTPFVKEKILEEPNDSKVLNDIANKNLKDEKILSNKNISLDDEVNNIFK